MSHPDPADEATALSEKMLAAQLTVRKPVPLFTGRCHNCSEPINEGTFCPPDEHGPSGCAEDYEARTRYKNGV